MKVPVLVFPPADHSHRDWRLAAVQELAREHAPRRINAVERRCGRDASCGSGAIWMPRTGVTGQLLPLDDAVPAGGMMRSMSSASASGRPVQRRITYLRLSVTDRCDLRCAYCMPERQTFLPRKEVLSLEELHELALGFIARGVTKIRLTGGEPLVRRDMIELVRALGRKLGDGLDELTLTTNGTQLAQLADDLCAAGVRRVNVSLDTLDRATFAELTRRDRLPQVLEGIAAATGGRVEGQAQHRGAEGRQRGRDPRSDRLGAWAGHGTDPDRGHAAGRGRGGPVRPVPAALRGARAIWSSA